jgi:starch-binding outer membrane protein, SusD/RagB family
MKKLKFLSVFAVIAGLLLMNSCSEDFLQITPAASLDQSVLGNYDGIDALLVGAYALIDGVQDGFDWNAASSGWVYGSIRGMEANKGTDSGDQPDINPIQTYSENASNPYLNAKWLCTYEGIARCNSVISTATSALDAGKITQEQFDLEVNQARALRGVYHFWAWKLWADRSTNTFVPYVDENTDQTTLTNTEDIRPKIIEDLTAGTNLPLNVHQIGRFNKTVCQVFLAKAQMNMYHDYGAALTLLEAAESGTQPAGGEIGLMDRYGDIFDASMRNEKEAIYTVQYSVNDNSGGMNAGSGEVLNFPYKGGGSPGGCCGFFNPTQDFVNSFRTDAAGLPYIDLAAGTFSYNDEEVTNDQGLAPEDPFTPYAGRLDPRVDWAVGRRGIPYWDWGPHTGSDWIRDQTYSGPWSPKKQVYKKSQEGTLTEVGSWTSGYTANGYRMIRFADLLLLKAECKAMTNTGDLGLAEVNEVRTRAANPDGFVLNEAGDAPAANYVIGNYTSFANQDEAMMAIKFERKLELGQEGHRYYDLQRWGDVQSELTRILAHEKSMPWGANLYGSATIGSEDVNFPIPQRQIDISNGNLVQNR